MTWLDIDLLRKIQEKIAKHMPYVLSVEEKQRLNTIIEEAEEEREKCLRN